MLGTVLRIIRRQHGLHTAVVQWDSGSVGRHTISTIRRVMAPQKLGAVKSSARASFAAKLRNGFPPANLLTMRLPFAWYPMPGEQHLVWAFATPAQLKAYRARLQKDAATQLWTFRPNSLILNADPINDIWKPARKPPAGAVAHLRVGVGDDFVFVDMMSVNPKWRRLGINTAILKQLLRDWPKRRLIFSKTTHDGQAFAEAWRRAGHEVEVEGERKKVRLVESTDGDTVHFKFER